MTDELESAIRVLAEGGIVIFPTDTAFGIGCRMDDREAVKRLFRIRRRPVTQAMPVLVESWTMAARYYASPMPGVMELAHSYWPGALTIVASANVEAVPELVRGGAGTVGIRVPDHRVPLRLIAGTGVPLLGPSANFHGDTTPFLRADLNPELVRQVDFVIDGTTKTHQASTVIDCTGIPWKVLRQGALVIDPEEFRKTHESQS